MKKMIGMFFVASGILFGNESFERVTTIEEKGSFDDSSHKKSRFYPYGAVGLSSFVVLPYGANVALGVRTIETKKPLGIDLSLNYTTTYISQYIFGKVMTPIFLQYSNVENSFYLAPFVTFGWDQSWNQFDFDRENVRKKSALLAITGISFGHHKVTNEDNLIFWQVGANIRRFDVTEQTSTFWPTMTFLYGRGF